MNIAFMGIQLPTFSQNGPTKFVVWIFGGQSTVPPLRSSLAEGVEAPAETSQKISIVLFIDGQVQYNYPIAINIINITVCTKIIKNLSRL